MGRPRGRARRRAGDGLTSSRTRSATGTGLPLLPSLAGKPASLCQTEAAGCSACCGLYNFRDRSPQATHARLQRRTQLVNAAFDDDGLPDEEALAEVKAKLMAWERTEVLTDVIKVCPFAGYLEEPSVDEAEVDPDAGGRLGLEGRVGCLLHPARMPDGRDVRHLAVYPQKVCAEHLCAPHGWLRPVEVALAQAATGLVYGQVVTDAGLVKAIRSLLELRVGRPLTTPDALMARPRLAALFELLFVRWPFADPDPLRFGGVRLHDDGEEHRVERSVLDLEKVCPRPLSTVLDAAGSCFASEADLDRARALVDEHIEAIVAVLG